MLKSIISFIWGESETDLSLDEAYKVLEGKKEEQDEFTTEKPQGDDVGDYTCFHRTGVVTAAEDGRYTIDHTYEFKSSLQNLEVSMPVSFIVYTSKSEIRVTNVVIQDDWFGEHSTQKSSWCARSLICKVIKRNGRAISVMPFDFSIDLNNVASEFIPIVGDWVELQAKVELDEKVSDLFGQILEVEKIRPLRPRILEGRIKQWCDETKTGAIDRVIFFNGDALSSGYVPMVGDKVVTEVIESEQGRYTYRSLKIIPEKQTEMKVTLEDNPLYEFEDEKEDVFISSNVLINAKKLGETQKFVIEVSNNSKDDLILLNVSLPSNNSQCKITQPLILTNITIRSGVSINFEVTCTVKSVGITKELVLFSFVNFNIGRWITVSLESNFHGQNEKARNADRGSILLGRTLPHNYFKLNPSKVARGQKLSIPPRFIAAKLPEYPVPQKLMAIVNQYEGSKTQASLIAELGTAKRSLSSTLAFNTYEDRFHTLLHLEEIQELNAVKNYAQSCTCFIKNGDYMMLEIPHLSEKRPSLMIGDRIYAKDAYDPDAEEFEGFIYKVGAKHVSLKFAQNFHDTYNNEDVAIIAVTSRTTFRRMHQAISLAIRNLENSFLFPTKINKKQAQVNFVYEKYYDDMGSNVCEETSVSQEEEKANDEKRNPPNKKQSRVEKLLEKITERQKLLNNSNGGSASSNEKENEVRDNKQDEQLLLNEIPAESSKTFPHPNKKEHNHPFRPAEPELKNSNAANAAKSKLLLVSPDDDQQPVKYTPKNKKGFYKQKTEATTQSKKPVLKLEWFNSSLNYYQKEAVRNILLGEARPLPYFIFGPPGTGKTVTLVESILQLLRLIPHSRLLVATPSNSAADLIALRLIDSGVLNPGDLVRLVAYRCVVENMVNVRLVPYSATVEISREGTSRHSFNVTDNGLTLGCNSSVIGRHRITVGTCASLGILYNMGFPKGHFTHIIVDEAGQATEPEVMIPLTLLDAHSGQVILAGDPLQLGPVIGSKSAIAYGLEETFLDRMLNRFPYVRDSHGFSETGGYDPLLVTRLIYNYRSLPDVLTLSSNLFYDKQLISTISPIDSKEAKLLDSLKEILPCGKDSRPPCVVFHGVVGENYQSDDCPSWFNPNEASQVFYYVNELYRLGLKSTDIGIISPYVKQVRQIRALFNEAEFDVPKVGTVEEFQGQEFNVIILTTVRSSDKYRDYDLKYKLGFLSNPRRVNVAITRAQALMIVVGNPHLLCNDPHWRSVIKYCIDKRSYCGCDLPCFT